MTREPWMSYVQHCERCDIVMVESPAGVLVFSYCPCCSFRANNLPRFQAKMMEASGRYDGHRNHVDRFHNPFWIKGSDS